MLFASGSIRRFSSLAMVGVLGLALALVGCDNSEPDPFQGTPDGNIVAVLTGLSSIQNTGQAVTEAQLTETLSGNGPYTVFAPLDQPALLFLSPTALLRTNPDLLPKALLHHVVARSITQADLVDGATFETLAGSTLRVQVRDGRTFINDVAIRRFDVPADNGTVHLMEGIMLDHFRLEERLSVQPNLTSLRTALVAAGLVTPNGDGGALDNPGEITVFAPTNTAFSQYRRLIRQTAQGPVLDSVRIAQQFLPYHVVPGRYCIGTTSLQSCEQISVGQVYETLSDLPLQIRQGPDNTLTANNTPITTTNIRVAEGVVHLIEDILTKPLTASEFITIRPDFVSLEAMLRNANLFGTVGSTQGITLFAPNEAAVETLPSAGLPLLTGTSPDVPLLNKLLPYHVAPQIVCSSANRYHGSCTEFPPAPSQNEPAPSLSVPTLVTGSPVADVTLSRTENSVPLVNGLRLVQTDIEVRNGVVHVIEGVMDDPLNLFEQVKLNGLTALRDRLSAAGLNTLLADDSQDLTFFAPNNSAWLRQVVDVNDLGGLGPAFTDLALSQRQEILKYHVVEGRYCLGAAPESAGDCQVITTAGETLPTEEGTPLQVNFDSVNGFTVQDMAKSTPIASANITATNGILHIIPATQAPPDLIPVGHLLRYHPFGTEFWARLENANATRAVRTAMNQGGPYTVFAFSGAAFLANRTTWQQYGNPQHPSLLCYHVVEGEFRAADLQDGQQLTTIALVTPGNNVPNCEPRTLTVQRNGSTVRIVGSASSAQVIATDIIGENGVLHFVDNILRFPNPN